MKATTFSPRLMMVKLPSTGTLQIIDAAEATLTFNQIEAHLGLVQLELSECTKEKDISIITAYSPLGHNITGKPRIINNEKFLSIGPLIRSKFKSLDLRQTLIPTTILSGQ
ncbi:uncharacterized protein L203_101798 [Cryptococcus depauperatus CBS 7841]|uniref:Uncharacterized protein n=1 Tax=Cryptococcus depauperatus CBS 7841 TaxID=1295531 RepID=A0AAJ8JQH5_9TREE